VDWTQTESASLQWPS